jgi:hypothetical protein
MMNLSGFISFHFLFPFFCFIITFYSCGFFSFVINMNQLGSLAGAAHLLKYNASVPSGAQIRQKRIVEHKGKSSIDFNTQYLLKL